MINIEGIRDQLKNKTEVIVHNVTQKKDIKTTHSMSSRQLEVMLDGSINNTFNRKKIDLRHSLYKLD